MTGISLLSRNPAYSRALALSLLIMLLMGLAWLIYQIQGHYHRRYDDAIDNRLRIIAGYNRVAAGRSTYESVIERSKKLDTARQYLKSSSPALAAAEMQEIATSALAFSQMKQNSVNIAPHRDIDGRRMITVNYVVRGTLDATQKMLYALESSTPFLFVDNLSIRSSVSSRHWRPTPNLEPEVQVQFDLYGYSRIGKKS